jgi:hypothetical protein
MRGLGGGAKQIYKVDGVLKSEFWGSPRFSNNWRVRPSCGLQRFKTTFYH